MTERLEFDRMKPWVRRIIRPKYARPGDAAASVQQAPPPTSDDLDELLPDRWKLAHPEAVLKFREDERRQVDDRKKDRRDRRRREKQLSHKLQSDKRRVNSG